jgi:hypothetical protein
MEPSLYQLNPFHTFTASFCKINFSFIFKNPLLGHQSPLFLLDFQTEIFNEYLIPHACYYFIPHLFALWDELPKHISLEFYTYIILGQMGIAVYNSCHGGIKTLFCLFASERD